MGMGASCKCNLLTLVSSLRDLVLNFSPLPGTHVPGYHMPLLMGLRLLSAVNSHFGNRSHFFLRIFLPSFVNGGPINKCGGIREFSPNAAFFVLRLVNETAET